MDNRILNLSPTENEAKSRSARLLRREPEHSVRSVPSSARPVDPGEGPRGYDRYPEEKGRRKV